MLDVNHPVDNNSKKDKTLAINNNHTSSTPSHFQTHNQQCSANTDASSDCFKGRYAGIVRWYNNSQGFGFITSEQLQQDVFVRQQSLAKCKTAGTRRLKEGQSVDFELIIDATDGLEAVAVEVINSGCVFV